jgi:hypothetical protein
MRLRGLRGATRGKGVRTTVADTGSRATGRAQVIF